MKDSIFNPLPLRKVKVPHVITKITVFYSSLLIQFCCTSWPSWTRKVRVPGVPSWFECEISVMLHSPVIQV
jgi:hypothetical protein